ncbi:MAG: GIY-YIG nuclease family protein [bacterium]|nr:GIY-YIG nuclease family protein [bacterium]
MRYVYMLRCADETLYTGITTDLEKRISEHNTDPKGAAYTASRRPVTLVRSCEATSRSAASSLERQIKHLTRTQKLEMIE